MQPAFLAIALACRGWSIRWGRVGQRTHPKPSFRSAKGRRPPGKKSEGGSGEPQKFSLSVSNARYLEVNHGPGTREAGNPIPSKKLVFRASSELPRRLIFFPGACARRVARESCRRPPRYALQVAPLSPAPLHQSHSSPLAGPVPQCHASPASSAAWARRPASRPSPVRRAARTLCRDHGQHTQPDHGHK